MSKSFLFIIFVILLNCENTLIAQINYKSKVHQPSSYVPPFDLQAFESIYNSGNIINTPTSNAGIAVKKRHRQFNNFPSQLNEGWHKVYAIAENSNQVPTNCYSALAYVKNTILEGMPVDIITEFRINNQILKWEISDVIENCNSNVRWQCGMNANGEVIYCGFEIYFLEDLERYNSSGNKASYLNNSIGPILKTPIDTFYASDRKKNLNPDINTTNHSYAASNCDSSFQQIDMPVYGNNEFYDGYQIADFAKQVKFKPRNYTFKEWENAVITVFANKQGSAANSKQINIEAMYLCERQSDVMYRRYKEYYGSISTSTFDRYCRLFIILLKTDSIKR